MNPDDLKLIIKYAGNNQYYIEDLTDTINSVLKEQGSDHSLGYITDLGTPTAPGPCKIIILKNGEPIEQEQD